MRQQETPINSTEARYLISELQTQVGEMQRQFTALNGRVALIPIGNDTTQNTPQAVNQILNGSFSHSVNSWANVGTANNGRYECASWFSVPIASNNPMYKANQIVGPETFVLGVVSTVADTITITGHGLATGTAFTVTGNRPSPLALSTVYFAIVIDANTIQVAASYADAMAGTFIPLTTTTTGGNLVFNFTLKDDSHTEYSPEFSDWDITTGQARLAAEFDLSCFLPGNNIEAGYYYYPVFSIVKANQYIAAQQDCRIFAGLYGYSTGDSEWDWLSGAWEVTNEVLGTVSTPTSREYRVFAQSNRGVTYVSEIETVASAPSDADFGSGATVFLSWASVLNTGVTSYAVYRNTGGTYVKLSPDLSSTQRQYIDNGSFQSAEGGWPASDFDALVSYTASGTGAVASLPYAGDPLSQGWNILPFAIRVPQNYDKGDTDLSKGQWLRFGLNKNLDIRVEGVINPVPNNDTITTTAGQFTAEMVGSDLTIVTIPKGAVSSATITAVTDSNNITFTPPGLPAIGAQPVYVTVIEAAPPHSLLVDLTHLTYIPGAGFSPNPEDISPDRGLPAATPNGTTQEGPPPGNPPTNPDGFPPDRCLHELEMVETVTGELPAREIEVGMFLPDGFGGENIVAQKDLGVAEVFYVETENGCTLMATGTKKIYTSDTTTELLKDLFIGSEIVTFNGVRTLSKIKNIQSMGRKIVVQLGLLPNHSFLAGSKGRILVDNRKPEPFPDFPV